MYHLRLPEVLASFAPIEKGMKLNNILAICMLHSEYSIHTFHSWGAHVRSETYLGPQCPMNNCKLTTKFVHGSGLRLALDRMMLA